MNATTMVMAIDPGNTQSAFVVLDAKGQLARFGIHRNEELRYYVREWGIACPTAELAIEMVASYGMTVGREVFDTCVWTGRFIEAWVGDDPQNLRPFTRVYRSDVKAHLCKDSRAKDGNIRQALIDKFGPGKDVAIGTKKQPGPLYGVSADVWAALAVGVTWREGGALREARS